MNKRDILKNTTFDQRVAEEEVDDLASYFVETEQWANIWSDDVDVVYGPKGSGKSAIYFLLSSRLDDLFDRGIILIPAENPRGTPAFSDLVEDPPTSEAEFRSLWKLYFLTLLCEEFRELGVSSPEAAEVVASLEGAKLLEPKSSLQRKIKAALDYVRSVLTPESIEGTVLLDPTTGMPKGVTGKISLREPSSDQSARGVVSIDDLFRTADVAFDKENLAAWM